MSTPVDPFLKIRGLRTHFPIEKGVLVRKTVATVKAVDGIDLTRFEPPTEELTATPVTIGR